jgi:hypothetical protein
MNHELQILSSQTSTSSVPVPQARVPIHIRPAVMSDVPFMDALQKMHTKQVGFFPTKQFEGNIRLGRVLIAEEVQRSEVRDQMSDGVNLTSDLWGNATGKCNGDAT